MILGTAGHIDHGKTTLVMALTGVDTDRLPEEKRRGITIDLGFAPLVIDGVGTIGIVDVPGHEAFIRTMLAGASGIDIALLVIAADEGVMPQTREHLDILSLLAVQRVVVVLTKADLVADDWMALVRDDVETLLSVTPFSGSRIVPVSAQTGDGLASLREAIGAAAASVPSRGPSDDIFRMPVDRVFTVRGTGTIVTGTIWSGSASRESALVLRPGDKSVRVRGVQTHGVAVTTAHAGERAALALAGCDVADVGRGSVLVGDPAWVATSEIYAEVEIGALAPRVTSRTRLRFHLGTSDVGCRIAGAGAMGGSGVASHRRARVVLDQPVIARGGDRFVLRVPSPPATIGGGLVVDPYPPRSRRPPAATGVAHSASTGQSPLAAILAAAGIAGVRLPSLPVRLGVPMRGVESECATLGALTIEGRVFSPSAVAELTDSMAAAVSAHAVNFPLEPGVSLQTLRASAKAAPGLSDLVMDRLVSERRVELDRGLARPAGWKPQLDASDQALSDSIMHDICIQPNEPPGVQELYDKFGKRASALLRKLERDGQLERVSDERYYSRPAVAEIVSVLRSTLVPGRVYSPGELREVLGVSRKYLIPLLEYCDRSGVTVRSSAGRAIVPERA